VKVSITLPSLYPDLVNRAIGDIKAAIGNIEHEIVVASSFEVAGPNVIWVREDNPTGNVAAHDLAYRHCTGDIVALMSDDIVPTPGWMTRALDHLLAGERRNKLFVTGVQHVPFAGTVFGLYCPFFPLARRSTFESVGGYFAPEFRAHYGDPDLGLRVWAAGGRVEPLLPANMAPLGEARGLTPNAPRGSYRADRARFIEKWKDTFGRGWPTDEDGLFNININAGILERVLHDGTICMNDPKFGSAILAAYDALGIRYARDRAPPE
jgi:hypothetical protein